MMDAVLPIRHLIRFLTPAVAVIIPPILSFTSSSAGATDIWMWGTPQLVNKGGGWADVRADAGDMWKPDAPWKTVAGAVKVIQFPPPNLQSSRDEDLKQALSDIKRRKLDLAIEASLLVRDSQCRSNTEAYSDPGATEQLLLKIQRNGGDLKYLIMDEPFFFGHQYSGPTACHESAEALAKKIAEMTVVARRIFPHLAVGTVDVVDQSRQWVDDLLAWADTYKRVTGEPLAFFHTDVSWSEPAIKNLVPLEKGLRERHIPFGVIYNADAETVSDQMFLDSARRHISEIEVALGIHPDSAIFQSWVKWPTRMLPETQRGTYTNLVFQYLQPNPNLNLNRRDNALEGRLAGPQGQPIASAQVFANAIDTTGRMGPIKHELKGKVPERAASGLVGIRANLDGSCACAGDGAAVVGLMHYSEAGTGRSQDIKPFNKPNPSPVRQIKLSKNVTEAPNLQQFPVTPGADYTLDVPMSVTANGELAGYITLIFMDSANKNVKSDLLWFRPTVLSLDAPTTDGDGRFRIAIPPKVTQAAAEVRVYYPGSNALRPRLEVAPR
jgi:hypothetical protein